MSAHRRKYSASQKAQLGKVGHAFKYGGGWHFPVVDAVDLKAAIPLVGQAPDDHQDAVRRYLMRRARELGCSALIPDSWHPDGSLRDEPDNQGDDIDDGSSSAGNPGSPGVTDGSGSLASSVPVAVRASQGGSGMVLVGEPIVYGVDYQVHDSMGTFTERMAPGCANGVLRGDCAFLFNHDGLPMARTPGTLTLTDGPSALKCTADLSDTQASRDLYSAVRRGDLRQMSVGFLCGRDSRNKAGTCRVVQTLAKLLDVSAVTYPASPTTSIKVARSAEDLAREAAIRERALLRLERVRRRRR